MTRLLTALAGLLLLSAAFTARADTVARELPLVVQASNSQTQFVHLRIRARPSFTFVRGNEEYSNFTTQVVLVRDDKSGDVVSTFRQSDINFADAYIYIPSKSFGPDHKATLSLQPSSPWILTADIAAKPVEVVSVEPVGAAARFQTYELMFGKPDDTPFLGDNISYAEGAYRMAGSWVFNKFFRYADTPSSLHLPLEPNSSGFLTLDVYLSANSLISLNGKETAIFERSLGSRFFQDFYRTRYQTGDQPVQTLSLATVAPFRATPTNLRQMAFALNAVEVAAPRSASAPALQVASLLNTRLDYRQSVDPQADLLHPRNAVEELIKHQGAAWLPSRRPVPLPAGARRVPDAVVLLDPVLNAVADTNYASGDVWVEAAAGTAMMLESQGYSVVYATPDQLDRLRPSVVYIPSQPFYRDILTSPSLQRLTAAGTKVIIDASFSGDLINSQTMIKDVGFQFMESAYFLPRDEVVFDDGTVTDTFQATPVMEYKLLSTALKPEASLRGYGKPIAFTRAMGPGSVSVLAFPAGYYFYNYGLRPVRAVIEKLLKDAPGPLLSATSPSRVRAYVLRQDACAATLMVENDNFGPFNYYGFAKAFAVAPSESPPPVSRVSLKGRLFGAPHRWEVAGAGIKSAAEPAGGLTLFDLKSDTVLTLTDRACPAARAH